MQNMHNIFLFKVKGPKQNLRRDVDFHVRLFTKTTEVTGKYVNDDIHGRAICEQKVWWVTYTDVCTQLICWVKYADKCVLFMTGSKNFKELQINTSGKLLE